MRKIVLILFAFIFMFVFTACQTGGVNYEESKQSVDSGMVNEVDNPSKNEKVTSLSGKWKEKPNKLSHMLWYELEIDNDLICIYCCEFNGARNLTWKGTYKDPIEPVNPYSFESKMIDKHGIEHSRDFSYIDGVLSTRREYDEKETTGWTLYFQKVEETENN